MTDWYTDQCKATYKKMHYHDNMASKGRALMLKYAMLTHEVTKESKVDEAYYTALWMFHLGKESYHTILYRRYSSEVDRVCPKWTIRPDWVKRLDTTEEMTRDD